MSESHITAEELKEGLKQVIDPELHYSIVDLGLVYGTAVDGDKGSVDMTLTSPGCPYGPMIIHQVKDVGESMGLSETAVNIVWEPPWGPDNMSEEIRLELGFDI